ncbi:MAG TPA: Gfo/Idh/MocA family oxidoreductase [Chloroflexota bacterium]|jgi:predicted dehydrogenase|nr:Gfo/Idh/MocA family oxidoreductase [Chloroflexota bacterium]
MPQGTVGLGLVGAGGSFGTFIESALRDVEGAELVAIADVNAKALAHAKEELHVDRAYSDWQQLADDPQVQAVIVASPPFTQYEIANGILQRGKALFLEKPGSIQLDDLRTLVDLQRSRQIPATIDYVMRWNPLLDVVRQVRQANWLGELRSVQFVNYAQDEVLPPQHWFWDRQKSGGIFIEHGVHFFDLYGELAGTPPKEVAATRSVRDEAAPGGRIDQVDCAVLHDNGIICAYFHTFNRPKALERQQALLAFDRGFLTVQGWVADAVELDGWVDQAAAEALTTLPHLVQQSVQPFDKDLHGRDVTWRAASKVTLRFGLPYDRDESYRRQVAQGLSDLVQRLRDPQHRQRVTLTDALRSLAVACVATRTASIEQARDIYARYHPSGW